MCKYWEITSTQIYFALLLITSNVPLGVHVPPIGNSWCRLRKGAVATRAGFKLIWPISSNRSPRQRGPALRQLTNRNLQFYRSWLWIFPAQGPVFFKGFWETKTDLKLFQLDLLPPSKYTKTLLYNHLSIQIKQLRSLKMSL